jgi:septum formation protein
MSPRLILASSSRTRRELLTRAGLVFEAIAPDVDERAIEAGLGTASGWLDPSGVAQHLATAKAMAVATRYPDAFVIGADQTLALGTERFSKPRDRVEARAQLKALRNLTHTLHSAAAIVQGSTLLASTVATARMTLRPFSEQFLDAYLDQMGERITSTVGGYELEGPGVQLFASVEGDYFTVLGLPLLELLADLRALGALPA